MAQWSGHWTHNPLVRGLIPALTTCWICSRFVPSSNPQPCMLVNSQVVRLLPVGIIKHIMFYLNYCFIIPEKLCKGSG